MFGQKVDQSSWFYDELFVAEGFSIFNLKG